MRSFILLALIADNPAAAAGPFDWFGGAVVELFQPQNMPAPTTPPGSSLAEKLCISTAPAANTFMSTLPLVGPIIGIVDGGLNMVGVTHDARCQFAVQLARAGSRHVKNIIPFDAGPVTDLIDHGLGFKQNANLQPFDNIVVEGAHALLSGPPGSPYQSTNIGAPPPVYADPNGMPPSMPEQQMQYVAPPAQGMQYGAGAYAPAAPGAGDGGYGAPSRILHV